jgi:predicted RNA-binding Zn-ribbon protein involved in translation (DUF1610 family)
MSTQSRLRPKVLGITVEYACPNGDKREVKIEPNDHRLHGDSESCPHCGYHESVTLHVTDCPCGEEYGHYLYLLSRNSG